MTNRSDLRLSAAMKCLPVGVIIVDETDHVVDWNPRAEEFITCVGRPTLHIGMSLDGAHSEPHRPRVSRMMQELREGRKLPCKYPTGNGKRFRVSYNVLSDEGSGEYLGVAQVIEFLEKQGE